MDDPVDRTRLAEALRVLGRRHEALRLRVVEYPGLLVPMQVVDAECPDPLTEPTAGEPVPLRVGVAGAEVVLTGARLFVDPASLALLADELLVAYVGGVLPDDDERTQFIDVSEWQLEKEAEATPPARPADAGHVLRRLELPFPPTDSARTSTPRGRHSVRHRRVSEPVALTAWVLALARYVDPKAPGASSATELAFAWYDEGRSIPGTADVVGPLGCYVPVSLPARGTTADTITAALVSARGQGLVSGPVGDTDEVVAGFAYTATDRAGDTVVWIEVDPPAPAGPLHLGCVATPDGMTLTLTFDPATNDTAVCRRLLDSVVAVLDALAGDRAGDAVDALGADESALLTELSGEAVDGPGLTLLDILDTGLRGAPEETAVLAEDGTLTFAELDAAASTLAGELVEAGVDVGTPVLVPAVRSWRTVVAFIGALRAGAVYLPVDPAQPVERLRTLAGLVGARVLAGDRHAVPAEVAAELRIVPVGRGGAHRGAVLRPVTADDPAYLIFTSGSAGAPRPVVVQHGAAARLWQALRETVYRKERARLTVAVNAPFTFDASVKQLIQLASGHTLCLVPEQVRHDGRAMLDHLEKNQVDVLDGTPSHVRALFAARGPGDSLPGLLLLGGEPVDPALWAELAALPGRAVNLYGPTECTVDVSWAEITEEAPPSIGRPLPGVRVWVTDDQLRPVPAGVLGELCVGGAQLAAGYLGDDAATASRFITMTLADGTSARVYRTGDLVRFQDDGTLRFVGRADDQVKINGYRIEPGEIASVLRRHPGVAHAEVVAAGPGAGPALTGYVVPVRAGVVDPDRLAGINAHETRYLFDEIFRQQVYLRAGITVRDNAVVLDVGANIGMFSLFVKQVCPNARVFAFEPLDEVFDKLTRNTARYGDSVTRLPYGLSDADRFDTFVFYPGYSMMSGQRAYADPAAEARVVKRFLANERDSGLAGRAELLRDADDLLGERFQAVESSCRLRRLSDVLDEQRIEVVDLLKIDVQRAEADVLRGIDARHWPRIRQVAMEVHEEACTATDGRLAELATLLEGHGFRVVADQDALLAGTDRHALYAVRPEYADDPRPVCPARAGGASAGERIDQETLLGWAAERLPAYLVPDAIVVMDELPLTGNGKLDRARLPAPGTGVGTDDRVAPANEAEQTLLEVWQEVLGRDDFGVEDPFFAFGGDSIRAIRVRAAAAKRGLDFPLRNVIRHQTIRELVTNSGLASAVGEPSCVAPAERASATFAMLTEADKALLPEGLADAYPATGLQLGMIYHSELSVARDGYHVVTAHRVRLPLRAGEFRRALARLVAANPILRTSFDLGRFGTPLQLVHADAEVACTVETRRGARLAEVVATERTRTFDPAVPPLLRMHALGAGPDGFDLVVTHHHGILDGWSLHLLLRTLCDDYEALLAGGAPDGGPSTMDYRRHVELERHAVESGQSDGYWRSALADVTPLLIAEGDGSPPRTTRRHVEPLGAGLSATLTRVAGECSVPVKSLLFAVHLRVLGEWTGRDDVVTGLVVNARPGDDGADRCLGLFLNTVPLRAVIGTGSLTGLARRVWREERELAGHHLVPLSAVERAVGRGRLFDVFFNYTNFADVTDSGAPPLTTDIDLDEPTDVAFGMAVDFESRPATGALRFTVDYDGTRLSDHMVAAMAVRYRELLEQLGERAADPLPPVDPATVWTARVARLWQELTGAPPASGTADFLACGGDSLLALRFVATLRHRHGVAVDLAGFTAARRFDAVVRLVSAAA